jgi:hypothetical protein
MLRRADAGAPAAGLTRSAFRRARIHRPQERAPATASLEEVGSSAQGATTSEQVAVADPAAGEYVVRVANSSATGTFDGPTTGAHADGRERHRVGCGRTGPDRRWASQDRARGA